MPSIACGVTVLRERMPEDGSHNARLGNHELLPLGRSVTGNQRHYPWTLAYSDN